MKIYAKDLNFIFSLLDKNKIESLGEKGLRQLERIGGKERLYDLFPEKNPLNDVKINEFSTLTARKQVDYFLLTPLKELEDKINWNKLSSNMLADIGYSHPDVLYRHFDKIDKQKLKTRINVYQILYGARNHPDLLKKLKPHITHKSIPWVGYSDSNLSNGQRLEQLISFDSIRNTMPLDWKKLSIYQRKQAIKLNKNYSHSDCANFDGLKLGDQVEIAWTFPEFLDRISNKHDIAAGDWDTIFYDHPSLFEKNYEYWKNKNVDFSYILSKHPELANLPIINWNNWNINQYFSLFLKQEHLAKFFPDGAIAFNKGGYSFNEKYAMKKLEANPSYVLEKWFDATTLDEKQWDCLIKKDKSLKDFKQQYLIMRELN